MKLSPLVAFVLLLHIGHAQTDTVKVKPKFGFNIGANYTNMLVAIDNNFTGSRKNGGGIVLGLVSDLHISNSTHFMPKLEFVMQNSHVRIDSVNQHYKIANTAIEAKGHFTFRSPREGYISYMIIGPNVRIPLNNNLSSDQFPTKFDVAMDFGIGGFKAFESFGLAPEIRYSFGFLNINQNPSLEEVKYHSISLVFNFID